MNEKTASTARPRVVSSAISLGTYSIFTMIMGLLGTIIITRHYSTEEFGLFTLVLVLVSFLIQISTLGLELAVSRFIAGAEDDAVAEGIFNTALLVRVAAIVSTSLLAWLGRPLLESLFGQSLLPGFVLFVPLLYSVESLRSLIKATLQGRFLFSQMGIVDSIASFANIVLILVVVFWLKSGIIMLILARALASLLACIYGFVAIPLKKRIFFHVPAFRELIKFGYPLQLNDVLAFVYSRIDTIAVAAFLGPAEIGIYEVARKVPDYLRNLYAPFNSVYYPFISKRYALDGRQRATVFMHDAIRFVAFVTLFGAAVAILFGDDILKLIFSAKYVSSTPIFILLMINLSIALISNVMGTTLVASGDSQKPMFINFSNAFASWVGSVVFVPRFALMGAALANTLGTLVAYPFNRYFLRKRIDLEDAPYLKPIYLFCAWSLLVFFVRPESYPLKLVFLAGFVVAGFLLSIITKADVVLLMEGSGMISWNPVKRLMTWVAKL